MGAAKTAGQRLLSFLTTAQSQGAQQALRSLNLQALAGRPIEEIFLGLADSIFPDGGSIDEGIAREAFVETIAELTVLGVTDFDALTLDQMLTVFELYTTRTIEARLCNDIGANSIAMPSSTSVVELAQRQIHDFIQRGVSDALSKARAAGPLTTSTVQSFVDRVYEEAFEILRVMGEEASQ
jgi:hypothetical protein